MDFELTADTQSQFDINSKSMRSQFDINSKK